MGLLLHSTLCLTGEPSRSPSRHVLDWGGDARIVSYLVISTLPHPHGLHIAIMLV